MDPIANPYQPSAGVRPPELAGRNAELAAIEVLIGRAERGFVSQSIVLTGLRGVGKTVLLNEFAGRARERGWIVAQLEGPSELDGGRGAQGALRAKLARGLHSSMREALGRWKRSEMLHRAAGALKSFTLSLDQSGQWTVGIDVAPAKGRADTGHVEIDLPELAVDLAGAALSRGVGVLVCVDEMQQLPAPDLAALCAACHEAGQREVPFYLAGAGLPGLPAVLASAKSYAERLFAYSRLGPLGAARRGPRATCAGECAGRHLAPGCPRPRGRGVWRVPVLPADLRPAHVGCRGRPSGNYHRRRPGGLGAGCRAP